MTTGISNITFVLIYVLFVNFSCTIGGDLSDSGASEMACDASPKDCEFFEDAGISECLSLEKKYICEANNFVRCLNKCTVDRDCEILPYGVDN